MLSIVLGTEHRVNKLAKRKCPVLIQFKCTVKRLWKGEYNSQEFQKREELLLPRTLGN